MKLGDRDMLIVRAVAEFRQLTAPQIRRLFFHDRTRPPFDRAIRRLTEGRWLYSLGRFADDDRGGAAPYVYRAGRQWQRFAGGPLPQYRSVHRHMLRVAEAYVLLVEAERAGRLRLVDHQLEVPLGRVRADMLVTIAVPGTEDTTACYIEVEVCEKDIRHIDQKCADYIRLWHASNGFPYVVLVAPDEQRKQQMLEVVGRLGEDGVLFRVCGMGGFTSAVMSAQIESVKAALQLSY